MKSEINHGREYGNGEDEEYPLHTPALQVTGHVQDDGN